MKEFPEPYWSAPGASLYLGDARACLRQFPPRSIHCVVTSPPYWGLRDYGVDGQLGAEPSPDCGTSGQAQCGACFVCNLVAVFREVHRVLRNDGTAWLNLGDTYSGSGSGSSNNDKSVTVSDKQKSNAGSYRAGRACVPTGNLVGIPWRVALALQADGWVLRQDVIWHSPNKMPESVTSRCTKSHEHVFLLAKGNQYYFDAEAIQERAVSAGRVPLGNRKVDKSRNDTNRDMTVPVAENANKRDVWSADDEAALLQWLGANHPELLAIFLKESRSKSDVWMVPTRGYPGAHYATFSPRLIEPCILAGTSEHGCCAGCGRPYERVVVKTGGEANTRREEADNLSRDRSFRWSRNGLPNSGSTLDGTVARRETAGWRKACGCPTEEVVPALVLDPFVGSGTTVATALLLGRHGVGVDLSEAYLRDDAVPRIEAALRGGKVRRRPTVAVPEDSPPSPRRLRQ